MTDEKNIEKKAEETKVKGTEENGRILYPKGSSWLYIGIVGTVFLCLTVVFVFFPRTRYSELEKRDLKEFPDPSTFTDNPREYTGAISNWFSDSEPYRDEIMTMSMKFRDALRFNFGSEEDAVTFKPVAAPEAPTGYEKDVPADEGFGEAQGNPLANENAKVANAGIVIVGHAPNVRALMAFGGSPATVGGLIDLSNDFARAFPDKNLYVLLSSSASEFYMPDKAKSRNKPEGPVLDYVRQNLPSSFKFVEAHDALAAHTKEDIFLRTDHHWAPLGAYYAAEAFARKAGVPFKNLDNYERKVVHGYVGSMYGYSNDMSVKQSPEDFVYYVPKGIDYTTTYITYKANKDYSIASESQPYQSPFFKEFKDGSGSAYCTFMGGDQHIVHVKTGSPTGRKLLMIKDSYGNAIPGYLFYGFSDIHIIDFRYFNKNLKDYVRDNGVTDILLAFNIFNACTGSSMKKVQKFLTQNPGKGSSTTTSASSSSGSSKETDSKKENKTTENTSSDIKKNNNSEKNKDRDKNESKEPQTKSKDEKQSPPPAKEEPSSPKEPPPPAE